MQSYEDLGGQQRLPGNCTGRRLCLPFSQRDYCERLHLYRHQGATLRAIHLHRPLLQTC
jgi:hypothetical protein